MSNIKTERKGKIGGGAGGIRTLGTLLEYGALAKRCFRPLSHLTKEVRAAPAFRAGHPAVIDRRYSEARQNMPENSHLPRPTSPNDEARMTNDESMTKLEC